MDNASQTSVNWEQFLDKTRVYADLSSGYREGDLYIIFLDSTKTTTDLQKRNIQLQEGVAVDFWTDDGDNDGNPDPLLFTATLHLDETRHRWIAIADWDGFRPASEARKVQKADKLLV